METPTVAKIPSGSVATRLPLGVPLKALAVVALVIVGPLFLFHTLWGFPISLPVWGFLRYHTKKEPLFMEIWAGQLSYKTYYQP
jgi:type IV secretory pathway TrbD component